MSYSLTRKPLKTGCPGTLEHLPALLHLASRRQLGASLVRCIACAARRLRPRQLDDLVRSHAAGNAQGLPQGLQAQVRCE